MCLAVPYEVKAAIDRCLAANVATAVDAAQLLSRLQASELVHASRLGTNLATQLKAVAESEENYSEMIAYVGLVNRVSEVAGPTLAQAEQARLQQYTVRFVPCAFCP